MRWELGARNTYCAMWWDYVEPDTKESGVRGVYRMTEHGWWDVRTWFYKYDVRTNKGNSMYLSPAEYTEEEVRRIVENAWVIGKGEPEHG